MNLTLKNRETDSTTGKQWSVSMIFSTPSKWGSFFQQGPSKLDSNMALLEKYRNLGRDYDGYGALTLTPALIERAQTIIAKLSVQTEIFPGSNNDIHLEYNKVNGDFLQAEIYEDRIEVYKRIDGVEDDRVFDEDEFLELVKDFNV